jgi:hypothetical protein
VKEPSVSAAYQDSAAARLLSNGLANAARERGLSQRSLAKQLGYKQSVVLSHMALGRVPIPLERAAQIADLLAMAKREFLMAVLVQRVPNVDWQRTFDFNRAREKAGELVAGLELIAREPLDSLSSGQQAVMREVAADRHAAERWLSVHEVPAVALLRSLRPDVSSHGLRRVDLDAVSHALSPSWGPDEEPNATF